MPELTLDHIERIAADVRSQEIIFSRLPDELIDHICCDVEWEMQKGLEFYAAYLLVKQKMGSLNRLKEIQEETLYAVDTKYRYMKNTMKISGIAGMVLLGFGALFKIQHWSFAGVMVTLGALILAFVFMPSALGVLWKETHNSKRLFLFVSAFMAGFCFILGTLFKVQHWPGAGAIILVAAVTGLLFIIALLVSKLKEPENSSKKPVYVTGALGAVLYMSGMLFKIMHWPLAGTFLISGMIIISALAFPWYTLVTWKEESHVDARFIFMVLGFLLVILPGTLINLNLQQSYLSGYFSHLSQQQALYTFLESRNEAIVSRYNDSQSFAELEKMRAGTDKLIGLIRKIETDIISEAESTPAPAFGEGMPAQSEDWLANRYRELPGTFLSKPVAAGFLLPGCQARDLLEKHASDYMDSFSLLAPEEVSRRYSQLIDPANCLSGQIPEDEYMSLMRGLHSLWVYKNSILSAESGMLKFITESE